MIGISENNLNKTEKNKLIKEGPCIFPFKYKWKTHETCHNTEKGPICATEVNENKTLKKYGYCLQKKNTIKKLNKSAYKNIDKDINTKSEPTINMEKPSPPFNEAFIYQLTLLENLQHKKKEKMRALAYAKAKKAIKSYNESINSIDDIVGLPNIGKATIEKLRQFVETGKIQHLVDANVYEEENKKIGESTLVDVFTKIYGVGPKNAEKIIKAGIKSISELREKEEDFLNTNQKLGLKYYEDINQRIPRSEIDEYSSLFQKYFNEAKSATSQSDAVFEIVGSYRREAKDSGDIDIIISNKNNNKTVFNKFIDLLVDNNIILHKLTDGTKQIKILVIGKLGNKPARRIDFMYTTYEEYPFAILYFTGSQAFNTAMRQHALEQGYTMNEHRLENTTTRKSVTNIQSEKDIFKFLNLEYVEPKERIDLSSLKIIDTKPSPEKSDKPKSKVKLNIRDKFIEEFNKNGIDFLNTQSEKEISDFIRKANLYYHTHSKPLVSDEYYDIIKEYFEEKYPNASVLKDIGAPIEEHEKNKVTLPYEMASMDKIKPTSNALPIWLDKYNEPSEYIASVKLDGVSGLYVSSGAGTPQAKQELFTRGNGKIGQDISYLLPYFKLPTTIDIVIRGEFVISKENFNSFENKANARNAVAGIINSKKTNPSELAFVDFVAYEVIEPKLKPSEQYSLLKKIYKDRVCQYTILANLNNTILSDLLQTWRNQSIYDMDGIVVIHNKLYERKSGNPKHAFAFKMVLTDQKAEAKVVNVIWNPSKDGYLKPRVQIEPIQLDGVTIKYATGFNGAFIEKHNINIGSIIEIIRSGDVIPHITKVIKPSTSPKMPDVPYKWNSTHVDIMLETPANNITVITKNITQFFDEVDGLGPGNIKKMIDSGFDSVSKIIGMSKEDFLKVDGFKEKTANKLYTNIHNKIDKMTLPELISASNVFGRGFGDKKVELILNSYPDILTSDESRDIKVEKLISIKGLAKKTSEAFVDKISDFIKFINEANLTNKLSFIPPKKIISNHILNDKTIVFTGKRDTELENTIKKLGGIISNDMKSNVFALVSDDKTSTSAKMKVAKEKNIPILSIDEFKSKYL